MLHVWARAKDRPNLQKGELTYASLLLFTDYRSLVDDSFYTSTLRGAASWRDPVMIDLLDLPGVGTAKCDHCMYGLYTPARDGSWKLAKKPTQWASNSSHMLSRLNSRCDYSHDHQRLEGGRPHAAEIYRRDGSHRF